MLKKCVMVAALALVLAPASARADWLFTPNLGSTFGTPNGTEHFTMGAAIGWMGAGAFGWEADFSYTPEFFEGDDSDFDLIDGSNVGSMMFNVIVGAPVGGQSGGGFRPYFTTGIGMLSREIQSENDLFDINSNEWGFNLGGGAIGFVSDHVGFRGDIRYLRSFEDLEETLDPGDFDFWRGTVGVTFRW